MNDYGAIRDSYVKRISKATKVVEGLENNAAFSMIIDDVKAVISEIDGAWQNIPKGKEALLDEMRVTKLASQKFVRILDDYRHEISTCEKALKELEDGFNGEDADGE